MTVIIQPNQTLSDIAVQIYGDLSAVYMLAKSNNISITSDLMPGSEIIAPEAVYNKELAEYCRNNIRPATGTDNGELRLKIFTKQFSQQFM